MDRFHRGIKFDSRIPAPGNSVRAWTRISFHHHSHQRILSKAGQVTGEVLHMDAGAHVDKW
jgi:hypothetical protein